MRTLLYCLTAAAALLTASAASAQSTVPTAVPTTIPSAVPSVPATAQAAPTATPVAPSAAPASTNAAVTSLNSPRTGKPLNYSIINGKKFYGLQTARRYTGTTGNLSPQALAVMHHPRAQANSVGKRHSNPLPAITEDEAKKLRTNENPPPAPLPAPAASNPVLSVFSPQEPTAR